PGALARAADQPQAAAWPAAAGGRADDLARPQAAREDARSACARALAGRAHECLAAQLAPGLHPLGAPSGALPRAAPARLLDDRLPRARPFIVRPLPVPKTVLGPHRLMGQTPAGSVPAWSARLDGTGLSPNGDC